MVGCMTTRLESGRRQGFSFNERIVSHQLKPIAAMRTLLTRLLLRNYQSLTSIHFRAFYTGIYSNALWFRIFAPLKNWSSETSSNHQKQQKKDMVSSHFLASLPHAKTSPVLYGLTRYRWCWLIFCSFLPQKQGATQVCCCFTRDWSCLSEFSWDALRIIAMSIQNQAVMLHPLIMSRAVRIQERKGIFIS